MFKIVDLFLIICWIYSRISLFWYYRCFGFLLSVRGFGIQILQNLRFLYCRVARIVVRLWIDWGV
ncbi:hypothetical protein AtNW77_Chr2g0229621 [Arabidopsis thaliana]